MLSGCSRTPKLDNGIRIQDSREHPSLLPYMGKRRITGKRSMRNIKSVESPAEEARVKRIRCYDLLDGVGSSNFKQGDGRPTAKDNSTDHVISPKQSGVMGHQVMMIHHSYVPTVYRISAVSASDDYGIYGTWDDFLCKWQLSIGGKMVDIHPFRCESVSSVAIDDRTGAMAVAGNNSKLLVYVQPRRSK